MAKFHTEYVKICIGNSLYNLNKILKFFWIFEIIEFLFEVKRFRSLWLIVVAGADVRM